LRPHRNLGPGHVRSTRSRPLDRPGFDPRPITRPIGSARSLVGRPRSLRTRSPGGSFPRRRLFGVGPNHRAAPRRLGKPCGCPPRSRERCVSSTSANQPAPRALVGFARFPLSLSRERSEVALDGAPSASVSRARSPRRGEGRAPLGTVLRKSGASSDAPPGTAFSAVREASGVCL